MFKKTFHESLKKINKYIYIYIHTQLSINLSVLGLVVCHFLPKTNFDVINSIRYPPLFFFPLDGFLRTLSKGSNEKISFSLIYFM